MTSRQPSAIDPVARALAGADDQEFAAMIGRHRVFMLRVAASVVGPDDADDVVQEACIRAWRGRASFDGRNPGGWLATIVKHYALSTTRRRRFVTVVLDALPDRPDPAPQPEAATLAREVGAALAAALGAIPRDQADAVLLCDRDGLEYHQAAAVLGTRKATIGTRLLRARIKLRGLLAGA